MAWVSMPKKLIPGLSACRVRGPRRVSSDKADQARSSTRHLNRPGFTYALDATRTSAPSWAIPRRALSTPERPPDFDALAVLDGMGVDETSLG